MGNLGSAQLDSTIACSIMFLCDTCNVGVGIDMGDKHGNGAVSASVSGAEVAPGVAVAQAEVADGCGARIKENGKGKGRGRGKKGTKETNTPDWGVWSHKQLTSLVWALGHSNQDVLTYTAWTV